MSEAWKGGSTRKWRETRAAVLLRDGYRCRLRLDGCTTHATHVHHVKGKKYGDDPKWLVASCASCNLKTGDPSKVADRRIVGVTRW